MGTDGPHWDLALRHAAGAGVAIAPLRELEDADRVRVLIDLVWGEQVLPRELLRALQHAGSILIGAEADGRLVGFVLGFAGFAPVLHVHSHMLAVLPEWRSRGVGFALKLAQRADCLDHDVEEVRWTFDPLVATNARFNLLKLGAEAIRFLPGFYGEMTDRLNRGDRSDRFEVRWRLRSPRVERAIQGAPARDPSIRGGPLLLRAAGAPDAPEPERTPEPPAEGAIVEIPADHLALRRRDPGLGRRWREATAETFRECFESGLVAAWFEGKGAYVFEAGERNA
jgi:predicted GNAT superfamily acetyltransferase